MFGQEGIAYNFNILKHFFRYHETKLQQKNKRPRQKIDVSVAMVKTKIRGKESQAFIIKTIVGSLAFKRSPFTSPPAHIKLLFVRQSVSTAYILKLPTLFSSSQ